MEDLETPIVILPDELIAEDLVAGNLVEVAPVPVDPISAAWRIDADENAVLEQVEWEDEELARRRIRMPRVYAIAGIVSAVALSVLVWIGWDYYNLPVMARPFDALHDALRPSGSFGLFFGIAGVVLMVLNLGYLLRRYLVSFEWMGSLKSWMGFHIFTGTLGPAFIFFHASFAPHSVLGTVSFVAMVVVVISGLFGRFVFSLVPRSLEGRELGIEDIERRLRAYNKRLAQLGLDRTLLELDGPTGKAGLLETVARIFVGDRDSRRRYKSLLAAVNAREDLRGQAQRILPLLERLYNERQWVNRYTEFRLFMGTWRFLHRWLTIVLFALVLFHIALAVRFGNLF